MLFVNRAGRTEPAAARSDDTVMAVLVKSEGNESAVPIVVDVSSYQLIW